MKKLIFLALILTACQKTEVKPVETPKTVNAIQYGRVDFKWLNYEIKQVAVTLNGNTLINTTTSGIFDFVLPHGNYPYSVNILYHEGSKSYTNTVKIDSVNKIITLDN